MPKKLFFLERIIQYSFLLFLVFVFITTATFAITWAPGNPPAAAPDSGNVKIISEYWNNIYYNMDNVGIGTTTPIQKLDVLGNIRSTGGYIINNTAPTIYFQDTNNRSAMLHTNSNYFYILRGSGANSTSWETINGRWPLQIDLENNNAFFGSNVFASSFYDYDDIGYYVNPAGATSAIFAGNVGIGTTSPSHKLHVNGTVYGIDVSYGVYGQGGTYGVFGTSSGPKFGVVGLIASSASGSVGVQGQLTGSYQAVGRLGYFDGTNVMSVYGGNLSGGSRQWAGYFAGNVYAQGNVGIGVINPTQKLDVNGYVKGTGLCIGSDCKTSWPTISEIDTLSTVTERGATTSRTIRADGGFNVDGNAVIDSGGRYYYSSYSGISKFGRINASGFGIDASNNGDWDFLAYEGSIYLQYSNPSGVVYVGGSINDYNDSIVNIGENLDAAGYVKGTSLCIGNDCKTSWPSGGTATAFVAGAGAPSTYVAGRGYSFGSGGDQDGGLFSTGDGIVSIYTNASQSLTVKNGNVGIGTANPGSRLSVYGAITVSDPYPLLSFVDTNNGGISSIKFDAGSLYVGESVGPQNVIFNNKSYYGESMRINTLGNVGIGTASPAQKLDVAGSVKGAGFCIGTSCLTSWPIDSFGNYRLSSNLNMVGRKIYDSLSGAVRIGGHMEVEGDFHLGSNYNSTNDMYLADKLYDWDNQSYYIDPNGTSKFSTIIATTFSGSGASLTGTAASLTAGKVIVSDNQSNSTRYIAFVDNSGSQGIKGDAGLSYNPYYNNLTVSGDVYSRGIKLTSDRTLKKDIYIINNSLEKVLQLEGISFKWKNDEDGRVNFGVIAQDVEKVFPEVVSTNKETGLKSVEYANMVAPLIEAVKELSANADRQQLQIEELKAEIEKLKN